jgi:polysaccharide pyruvyl transferase WcaK-like protein
MEPALSSTRPVHARSKRILLAGAYANGNLGDQVQASTLARHLHALLPDAEIHAGSESKDDQHFEFHDPDRVAGHGSLLNADYVNSFDAILIGGGGLLAAPHQPFCDEKWIASVKAPLYVISVGATEEVALQHAPLLHQAVAVTGRDDKSLEALSKVRPDTTLLYDPLLADRTLDGTRRAPAPAAGAERVAVILRKSDQGNARFHANLPSALQPRDFVISMFPEADRKSGAAALFSGVRTVEAWTMYYFVQTLETADFVFSERYHGCIIALKQGLPCLGLGEAPGGKIRELFRQLGHPGLVVDPDDQISRDLLMQRLLDQFDGEAVRCKIMQMEDDFAVQFKKLVASI